MTATKTRKPEARSMRLTTVGANDVLWITQGKLVTAYRLTKLPSDFGTAYRLEKAVQGNGQQETYDVCILDGGRSTCECLGHLHHKGTVCKHVAALARLHANGTI